MHCPSCGTDTTLDQRFCRSCGMGLQTVSKLVAKHSSPEPLKREKSLSEKANLTRMSNSLKWGMISFILSLAALVLARAFPLAQIKWVGLIGLFLLFMAMGLMAYGVLSAIRGGSSTPRRFPDPGRATEFPETEANKELPPTRPPIPVASVTERTTQLIATEDVGKPRE